MQMNENSEDDDNIVTINMYLHSETSKGMLLSYSGKLEHARWVPKSAANIVRHNIIDTRRYTIRMLRWVALDRKFIKPRSIPREYADEL